MRYDYLRSGDSKSGATTSFVLLGVPFQVVANIPIEFLDVRGETRSIIVENPLVSAGKKICKFKTLGELASFGYEKLNRYIRTSYMPKKSFSQIMYEIQLALARFSLKLRGTDFTVFDIKISDLNLSGEANSFLKNYTDAETLGDLYIDYRTMKRDLEGFKNCTDIKKSIKGAMLEFGIRPEISGSLSFNAIQREKEALEKSIIDASGRVFPSITRCAKYSVSKPLSSMDWVSGKQYTQNSECDYTGLLEQIKFEFLTEDELVQRTGISEDALKRIKEGRVLDLETLAELCKFFGEPVQNLVKFKDTESEISNEQIQEYLKEKEKPTIKEETPKETQMKMDEKVETVIHEDTTPREQPQKSVFGAPQKPFDFSPLFEKIRDFNGGNLVEFTREYPISLSTLYNMMYGKMVGYSTIAELAEFFGCKPEDLFVADRDAIEQVYADEISAERKKYFGKEYDYTGLKIKLMEKCLSMSQMMAELNLKRTVYIKICQGEGLGDDVLSKISRYLGCSVSDIVTNRNGFVSSAGTEGVESDTKNVVEPETERIRCDYSGLFRLMRERGISRQKLSKEAIVHGYIFTYQINKGLPISAMYLKRICYYLGCREEDIVKYISTGEVKHESYGSPSIIAGMPSFSDDESSSADASSGVGASGSGKPVGVRPKFYMGKRGFLNTEHDIVRLHREKNHFDSELDAIEKQF